MPRNTSGTYTKPDGTTAVTGTPISSSAYNNLANDIASTLTDSLSRSGKGGMQADLSLNGKKVTNLAPGTAATDALRRDQTIQLIQQGVYGGISTGSANAQVLTPSTPVTAYYPGMILTWVSGFTNAAGALTVNASGLGNVPVNKPTGNLDAGDITANGISIAVWNPVASTFSLINPKSSLGLGTAAFRNVGLGGTDVPANANLGSAAYRTVGTASTNIPEIANGSGQFQSAVDAAHKALDNLAGAGLLRTAWASVTFSVGSGVIATFNGMGVTTLGVGHYALTFPNAGGTAYDVDINVDAALSVNGIACFVESGSRSATGCQIYTTRGNASYAVFDPDRISVTIFRVA